MGLQQNPGKPFPPDWLLWIILEKFLSAVPLGGRDMAPRLLKQELFTALWSAASAQGWQGHVSWFLLCGFHHVVPCQLFGDMTRTLLFSAPPLQGLGILFPEFAFAS